MKFEKKKELEKEVYDGINTFENNLAKFGIAKVGEDKTET